MFAATVAPTFPIAYRDGKWSVLMRSLPKGGVNYNLWQCAAEFNSFIDFLVSTLVLEVYSWSRIWSMFSLRWKKVIERIVEQVRAKLKVVRLVIGPQTLDSIERSGSRDRPRGDSRIVENESIRHECGDGYFGTRARCLCGQPARYVGSRPRRVISLGGAHSLVRPYYHCQRCGHGFSPLDRILGVVSAGNVSP